MVPPFNHQRIFLKNGPPAFVWMLSWPQKSFNSVLFPFMFSFWIVLIVWRVPIFSRLLAVIPVFFNYVSWHGFECPPHHPWHRPLDLISTNQSLFVKWNRGQCGRWCRVVFNATFKQPISLYWMVKKIIPC